MKMNKKNVHLGVSIFFVFLSFVGFFGGRGEILDHPVDNMGILMFGLFLMGSYGITKNIYDK